ncbi:conserved protein of unknown function [Burkholderia multivorans]
MLFFAKTLFSLLFFPFAAIHYRRTGHTTRRGHMALVQLFCATGGKFNDFLSRRIARRHPPVQLPGATGVLGDLDGSGLKQPLDALREQGYCVFPGALPEPMCEQLMKFALETRANVRRMDHEAANTGPRPAFFDPASLQGVRYDYATRDLLNNPQVQALLADPSLLALSQAYLGSTPRADVLSMWWHTPYHTQPDGESAQYFHFDLDRVKWLKVFVYLTDVGVDDGPHTFIAGSHRTGGIPWSMRKRGYVRLTDDEVMAHYGAERHVEFVAPRGTIIVEDTRGLHKGKHVSGKSRLVLQLQFSNSLFGTVYPKASITTVRDAGLADMTARAPEIYTAFR